MRIVARACSAVWILLLAGCVNQEEASLESESLDPSAGQTQTPPDRAMGVWEPTPNGTAHRPEAVSWWLKDCRFAFATFIVDETALAKYLPAGFRPMPAGAPAAIRLSLEVDECQEGSTMNGSLPQTTYVSFWTRVVPPQDLQDAAGVPYFFSWDTVIHDAALRQWIAEAGAPAREGWIKADPPFASGEMQPRRIDIHVGDNGHFAIQKAASIPASLTGSGRLVQYQSAHQGVLRWNWSWSTDEGWLSKGVVELDASSWQARVAGGSIVSADVFSGKWSYGDGTIAVRVRNGSAAG